MEEVQGRQMEVVDMEIDVRRKGATPVRNEVKRIEKMIRGTS